MHKITIIDETTQYMRDEYESYYDVYMNKLKKHTFQTYYNAQVYLEQSETRQKMYSKTCHKCLKTIFNNITNKKLVIEMGFKIYQEGGIKLLNTILYIFEDLICETHNNKYLARFIVEYAKRHLKNVFIELKEPWIDIKICKIISR